MKKLFVLLSVVFSVLAADELLLHYVHDEVSAGSYKYYSLEYEGIIKITLKSQTGDADLYISQTTNKPSYEPEHYCLQSITCGEDVVLIPQSYKRPVSIGVYGHPAHETSRYSLLVYHVTLAEQEYFDEQNPPNSFEETPNSKSVKKSIVITFLWTLLEQLFLVLF